jgi:hypothetical protein
VQSLVGIRGEVGLVEILDLRAGGRLRFRRLPARTSKHVVSEERHDALVVDLRSYHGTLSASPSVRRTLDSELPAVFIVGNDPGTMRRLRSIIQSPRIDFVRMTEESEEPADEIVERVERLIHQREKTTSLAAPNTLTLRHIAPDLHAPDSGRLDAARVARLLGVPLAELARLMGKRPGTVAKTPDAPALQPALRVFEMIAAPMLHMTGTSERLRAWLNAPNSSLAGESPMQLVREGHGQAVAGLAERIALGEPA